MDDETLYLEFYPDEGKISPDDIIGTQIHTSHVPVTAYDQYRIFGIYSTNLDEIGACFMDTHCASALAKIGEGGFTSFSELLEAEAGLQAVLLNELVFVIRPTVKLSGRFGSLVYCDQEGDLRTDFSHDILSLAGSRDWIICPDFFEIEHGSSLRIASTRHIPAAIGRTLTNTSRLARDLPGWTQLCDDAIESFISEHPIPAFIRGHANDGWQRGEGFQKDFYRRMNIQWDQYTARVPPVVCSFKVPPLFAIVLDRLTNRQDLLSVLTELREELAPVRSELLEMNGLVQKSMAQAELEDRVRLINKSFDSIVPESRIQKEERRARAIAKTFRLIKPLFRKMFAFAASGSVSPTDISTTLENFGDFVKNSDRLVDRTVTAKTFADLINTEVSPVAYFLSP